MGTMTTVTTPYFSGPRSLATTMMVSAETRVEAICPVMSSRLPRADPLTVSLNPSTSAKQPQHVTLEYVQLCDKANSNSWVSRNHWEVS